MTWGAFMQMMILNMCSKITTQRQNELFHWRCRGVLWFDEFTKYRLHLRKHLSRFQTYYCHQYNVQFPNRHMIEKFVEIAKNNPESLPTIKLDK